MYLYKHMITAVHGMATAPPDLISCHSESFSKFSRPLVRIPIHLHTDIQAIVEQAYRYKYVDTYVHAYMSTYVHMYIHIYIHVNTYIYSYIYTYMHTYIHT